MRPILAVAIFVWGVFTGAVLGLFFDTGTVLKPEREAQQQQEQEPAEAAKLDSPPVAATEPPAEGGTRHTRKSDARKKNDPIAAAELPSESATQPSAGSDSRSTTGQIKIKYTVPRSAIHRQIYERLKEDQVLETFREFLAPFRLPRALTVTLEGCAGDPNASYEDDAISICYDYIDELWKRAPTDTTKGEVAPIDAIIGPLLDTALHEFAHALFDMHHLPVFGREEDAADQVAAYITLQLNKADARRLILGTAYAYKNEIAAEKTPKSMKHFANVHSTPAQRLYNLLCLAYGSDSKLFGDLVTKGLLPKSRAEDCEDEYTQVEHAYKTIVGPFVDRELERKVMSKRWLPDPSTRVQPRPSTQAR